MNRRYAAVLTALLCLALALSAVAVVLAQTSAQYDLNRHVIGSGGGVSSSTGYRVHGTVGQSMAGPSAASSAGFRLTSGFWVFDAGTTLYLPAVLRNWSGG